MPSDDLILSLKQILGYPARFNMDGTEALVVQVGGLGGPYYATSAANLVGSSLASGGTMSIGGALNVSGVASFNTAQVYGNFTVDGLLIADGVQVNGAEVAATLTANEIVANVSVTCGGIVQAANMICDESINVGGLVNANNVQVNGVLTVGGSPVASMAWAAPIFSPAFTGVPCAPTPVYGSSTGQIATTAFVQQAIICTLDGWIASQPFVSSFNGRTGDVVLLPSDLEVTGLAPLASPAFTGVPTAPTPPSLDNSTAIATTAWVVNEVSANLGQGFAPINSPSFSGVPTAPTAVIGSSTGQLATTAFVMNAVTAATSGVASFNTRTGAVALTGADITGAGGAVLASPAFTGAPTAPTAAPGTNTQQLATTAFVEAVVAGGLVSTFNGRTGVVTLTAADVTGAGGAPIASPGFTGVPLAPTATAGTSTQQLATTAFVAAAIAAAPVGVATFNGRTAAVTLQANDISAAGGALLTGPAFTGVPTAPTAVAGTNTTQLATTAFVMAAVAVAGVSTFNGRAGAVVLTAADLTGAGGALLAGVTNGSNAVAGNVGEVLGIWDAAPGQTPGASGQMVNVGQLSLTPGDWDVHFSLGLSVGSATTSYQGGLSTVNTGWTWPVTAQSGYPFVQNYQSGVLGGQVENGWGRVNVATTTSIFLMASATYTGTTPTIWGGFWARRRR